MIDAIHHQIHEIEANPIYGTRLTIFSVMVGFIFNIVKEGHLHPLIMDVLQAGAWATGILVGVFTIIGYVKKWFKK